MTFQRLGGHLKQTFSFFIPYSLFVIFTRVSSN